jgi:magnesium chelatase subunit D
VGAISPHLLDRFALRLTWSDPTQQASRSHEERVIDLLSKNWQALDTLTPPPDPREFQLLEQAVQQEVELTTEALERVLDVLDGMTSEYYYPRRELALARYALALCQLAGETRLTTSHVEKAAALLGLQQESQERTEPLQESDESSPTEPVEAGSDTGEGTVKPPISLPALSVEIVQSVAAQAQGVTLVEPDNVLVPDRPYPEDTEPPAREAASLRVPFHRFTTGRSDRGPVFGVEPSETLEDLSITSTLLTALRFQKLRQKRYEQSRSRGEQGIVGEASLSSPDSPIQAAANADRLMIELNDLRRYRREHAPEEMLLLLLDYTSMRNCAWEDALLPFLSEAYIHRACISIIKVGAQDATSPLQAGLVEARSILVPRIGQALETPAGKASPLAHGLDLAQQILHRTLQHGRSAVQRVTLVVLSDGRGNVPLEASRKNSLTEIVAREGVDDSLKVAHILRGINRVEKILLNPQPRYYADLPYRLAEALGATVIDIPREALEAEATR